ncbi:MAG: 2-dehydro-3-deoxygalactonokinase, partial [Burkholderiales bacterium]
LQVTNAWHHAKSTLPLVAIHRGLAPPQPDADGDVLVRSGYALLEDAFAPGERHAQECGSLLHAAFSARTLALFERVPAQEMPSYLSGLVIGEELRAAAPGASDLVLVGSAALTRRYALALQELGCSSRSYGAEATWRGLHALARTLENP